MMTAESAATGYDVRQGDYSRRAGGYRNVVTLLAGVSYDEARAYCNGLRMQYESGCGGRSSFFVIESK